MKDSEFTKIADVAKFKVTSGLAATIRNRGFHYIEAGLFHLPEVLGVKHRDRYIEVSLLGCDENTLERINDELSDMSCGERRMSRPTLGATYVASLSSALSSELSNPAARMVFEGEVATTTGVNAQCVAIRGEQSADLFITITSSRLKGRCFRQIQSLMSNFLGEKNAVMLRLVGGRGVASACA